MVIALDTATDPADAVDVTFATDNFEAGLLIGQWAAAKLGEAAADAKIGLINIDPSQPVVGVKRNQGFLQGFGIDIGDPDHLGGRDRSAHRRPGSGSGNQEDSVTAMENLLQSTPTSTSSTPSTSPPLVVPCRPSRPFGNTTDEVLIVSVDGGCAGHGRHRRRHHRRHVAAVPVPDGGARRGVGHPQRPDRRVQRPRTASSTSRATTSSTPASR